MFSAGRSDRKSYWLMVTTLVVIAVALTYVMPNLQLGIPVSLVWILIYTRRLHDIGRSGWWQAPPLILSAALAVAAVVYFRAPVTMGSPDKPVTVPQALEAAQMHAMMSLGLLAAALLVQAAFTIWLGVRRGDPAENRFGVPA